MATTSSSSSAVGRLYSDFKFQGLSSQFEKGGPPPLNPNGWRPGLSKQTTQRWSADMKRSSPVLPILLAVVGGCDPYSAQQGEFNAGPVDPANFPTPYLGVGADTGPNGFRSGRGVFVEVGGYVNNNPAGYYSFPFTTAQLAPTVDPLRLVDDGNAYSPVPVARAYVFDPAPPSPFPPAQTCTPPPSYNYDPVR